MVRFHPLFSALEDTPERESNRQTASLAGLAIALALIVVGYYLVQVLHTSSLMEDCLLAGRNNCTILSAGI
jgi:hypothetical protein